ncbi:muscarinic acetylcholine receptor [Plakobranchus ocellatus]|uniref:Muscarinic acetylcholine receptor n=1 Tax=Plakobranchus ocellatus TaxID=259542 RepID=A0AAV4C5B0_9GAST|nr:muscarinic acetylcholine receptor [Plakobranchus ocellatus]
MTESSVIAAIYNNTSSHHTGVTGEQQPHEEDVYEFPVHLRIRNHWGYCLTLALAVLLVTLIVITIVTNLIVVVVFVTRENRKRSKNIYLANLSLIDLIIGLAVMPVCMLGLLNPNWLLPGASCKIHLVCLHSLVFASLLAVLLVSVDRWYSICYPFTYRVKPTGRIALYAVMLSWVLSFAVHIPLVGLWDLMTTGMKDGVADGLCHSGGRSGNSIHFINNAGQPRVLVFLLVLVKYTAPHIVMLLLKCSLYRKIKQRKNVNVRRSLSSVDTAAFCLIRASMSETAMNALAEAADNLQATSYDKRRVRVSFPPPIERRNTCDLFPPSSSSTDSRSTPVHNGERPGGGGSRSWSGSPDQRLSLPIAPTLKRRMSLQDCLLSSHNKRGSRRYFPNAFGNGGGIDNRRATIGDLAKNLLDKQDSKAAWFLSLLLVVSIVCWTPWTVSSLCHQFITTPHWMQQVALWLLLSNSTINPFLYGLINKDFRKVLAYWLRLRGSKRKRLKTALRMLSWQMAWGTMDLGGTEDGNRSPGSKSVRSSLTPCQEGEEC